MTDEEFKKLEEAYNKETSRRFRISEYKRIIAEIEGHINHFKNDPTGHCKVSYILNSMEDASFMIWANHFPSLIKLLEEIKQEYLDMIKELEEQENGKDKI